jgi:hypothetical protein
MSAVIRAGDEVRCRNAYGHWLPGVAASDLEGTHRGGRRVHDFPVYMVVFDHRSEDGPLPWPAEEVEPLEPSADPQEEP